jgi:tetratricopeptide (TPR) repeat protein
MFANNYAAMVMVHFLEDPAPLTRADAVARQLRAAPVPQFRDTYYSLLHVQGRHAEALEVLKPVAEALPGDAWANYHLGMVYLALGQPDLARAPLEVAVASTDPYFSKGASAIAALRGLSGEQEQ